MSTPFRATGLAVAVAAVLALGATSVEAALAPLDANRVVEKNVAARGGLDAWRGIQAMAWKGTMTAGGSRVATIVNGKVQTKERPEAELPFTLEFKRPMKTRLEIEFAGQTAVQVYDGTQGWKLRPFLNRPDPEPFTPNELQQASLEPGIDGWLIDAAAKGARVESAGVEPVDGHDCYKLKVTTRQGVVRHVWIDGKSFLEARIEGAPRTLDGRQRTVYVYPSDYRAEQGRMVPHVLQTAAQGVNHREKVVIASVTINPPLDDARFGKPAPATAPMAAATPAPAQ